MTDSKMWEERYNLNTELLFKREAELKWFGQFLAYLYHERWESLLAGECQGLVMVWPNDNLIRLVWHLKRIRTCCPRQWMKDFESSAEIIRAASPITGWDCKSLSKWEATSENYCGGRAQAQELPPLGDIVPKDVGGGPQYQWVAKARPPSQWF